MVLVKQLEEENNDKRTSINCHHWHRDKLDGIISGRDIMKEDVYYTIDIINEARSLTPHSTIHK